MHEMFAVLEHKSRTLGPNAAYAQSEYSFHPRHNGLFKAADTFILLSLPLSCGSGESSTGALCVRYWEEPWDFLCFWAFLMDFLVNPSTFSDAEMADILMLKVPKTSDELIYPPGQIQGFLFGSHQHQNTKPAARLGARLWSKSFIALDFPTWSHDAGVQNVDCYRNVRSNFKNQPTCSSWRCQ